MRFSSILSLATGLSLASAHGAVMFYNISGKWYEGYQAYGDNMEKSEPSIQRSYLEINPLHINPNSTNDQLICNNPGAPAKLHAPVVAGTNITAYWGPWTHAQGPLLVWMARCPSYGCSHFIPRGHDWFKIEQRGLMEGAVWDGLWGMLEMHNNNNSWTTTIPARLESGHYLIRHELVALHIPNTPEFYIQCGQLEVRGRGRSRPSSKYLASIPGVFSLDDPKFIINIFSDENSNATTWHIPGPPVWS